MLAVAYHQWLYGRTAIRQALNIIKTFRAAGNQAGIRRELRQAGSRWPNDSEETLGEEAAIEFPFITTCLAIGASVHEENDYSHCMEVAPLGASYNVFENDDGISIYDISDPSNSRYAFMFLFDDYERNEGDESDEDDEREYYVANTVLDARAYLNTYYTANEQAEYDAVKLVAEFDSISVIDAAALESAWPGNSFTTRPINDDEGAASVPGTGAASISTAISAPLHPAALSLRNTTMSNVISKACESATEDLEWIAEAEQLPDFAATIMSEFSQEPRLLCTPAGMKLLGCALKGSTDVDLTPFPDIKASEIATLLNSTAAGKTEATVRLSLPDMDGLRLEDLESIVQSGAVVSLNLGLTPLILPRCILDLAAGSSVEELAYPQLYSRAFDLACFTDLVDMQHELNQTRAFPCGIGTKFPLVQIFYITASSTTDAPRLACGSLPCEWIHQKRLSCRYPMLYSRWTQSWQ